MDLIQTILRGFVEIAWILCDIFVWKKKRERETLSRFSRFRWRTLKGGPVLLRWEFSKEVFC